jgi:hypothetical protein
MGVACGCRAEIEGRIAEVRGELERLGVRALHLFGSAARDELRPDSDVDVLVELDRPATLEGFMALKELLEDRLGRRVDLVTRNALRPRLLARIAGELRRVA